MGRKKGKGRSVKNARKKFGSHYESDELKLSSHTMVIHRGTIEKDIKDLIDNMRNVMEPYTAKSLKVTKKNSLKDFVSIAGPLHVTHLIVFTQTELGDYMKFIRVPRGPTIHFKLLEYSLANDVLSIAKKKHTHKKQYLHQPLLILNGFNVRQEKNESENGTNKNDHKMIEPQFKLLTTALQNMFPSINVTKVKLNEIRRCVLFHYNREDQTIQFRQYNIKLMPVGLSRTVKKLVQEKLPDLSNLNDISELLDGGAYFSESEAELDGPDNEVKITKDLKTVGSLNLKNSTSAIRLTEIGPRMKLKLFKIEEGVCDGEVLYHDLIQKSDEELKLIRESLKEKKKKLKQEKKASAKKSEQKTNGKRKRDDSQEEKKSKNDEDDEDDDDDDDQYEYADDDEDAGKSNKSKKMKSSDFDEYEDDVEYYKQELNEEPDADLFASKKKQDQKNKKSHKRNGVVKFDSKSTASSGSLTAKKSAKFLKFAKSKKQSLNNKRS